MAQVDPNDTLIFPRAAAMLDTTHEGAETPVKLTEAPVTYGDRAGAQPRLLSLDALRGATILLMLLVNNIALDIYTPAQLVHAPWNGGIHLADLVFPWFLFCVGVAIPFSAASFRRRNLSSWRYDLRVLSRTATLVALGCLIDSAVIKRPYFSLGVLQVIGLAYMVGALIYPLPLSTRLVFSGMLLVGYWWAIKFVPIPGVGAGVFQENQNLVQYINATYLLPTHLVGLPSVIPTAALVLIGTAIGDLFSSRRGSASAHRRSLAEWLSRQELRTVGIMLLVGGGLMLLGKLWSLNLGYSKAIWTPSYIVFSAGSATLLLGLLYLLIDLTGWRRWAYPLVVFGSNAIFAYVAPILTKLLILQEWRVPVGEGQTVPVLQRLLDICVAHAGRIGGGWLYTIGYIVVWWVVLWVMYRKKLFLRV
jgi:predicted acyltransferase